MDCLNAGEKKPRNYENFDVENMQTDQPPSVGAKQHNSSSSSTSSRRRCCSVPVLLGIAALLISTLALIMGIYAAVVARKLGKGGASDNGMFLTTDPDGVPQGWKAVNLFKGTGYFAQQRDMLHSRSDHKSFPIGTTVYLLGGLTDAVEKAEADGTVVPAAALRGPAVPLVLNATVAYDTYTERSQELADMPQPRFRFCGAVLNGQLYVIGGMGAFEAADAVTHTVSDRVMRFTPATNRWDVLPGRLNHPRGDCCAAAVGGKVYVAGGWTTDYSDTLGSVEVFDPASGAWSFAANLTQPRGDCEAVALDDRTLVVLGGVDPEMKFLASVESMVVTAADPKWTARANMNKARGDFAAEALPGRRIIVMGGETNNGSATEFAMYDVEEYMHSSDRWVEKAPLPEARFRFDTAHVTMGSGDRVLAFGGHPTCSMKKDTAKEDCVGVALPSVWAYMDEEYPDAYVAVKERP